MLQVLSPKSLSSYSYIMDTSGMRDMYTRGPQARGLRVYISTSVHIRQTTSGHSITALRYSHALW